MTSYLLSVLHPSFITLQEQIVVISLSSSSWRMGCRRCLPVFVSRNSDVSMFKVSDKCSLMGDITTHCYAASALCSAVVPGRFATGNTLACRCHTAHYCSVSCLEQDTKRHTLSGECLLMQSDQSRYDSQQLFQSCMCAPPASQCLHTPTHLP